MTHRTMLAVGACTALVIGSAAAAGTATDSTSATTAVIQGQAEGNGRAQDHDTGQGSDQAQGRGNGNGNGSAQAQGRGNGKGQGNGQGARGRGPDGNGPPGQLKKRVRPEPAAFNRGLAERSVQVRASRHSGASAVTVRRDGDRVRFLRTDGTVLFELDDDDADELGYWMVNRVLGVDEATRRAPRRPTDGDRDDGLFGAVLDDEDDVRGGSPAFCRSGAGHPVWGRGWCVDKGFGLGTDDGRWGWSRVDDVILREPDYDLDVLDRDGLIDILGDIVFGRLAVQSLVLGADEPLSGRWMVRDEGPRVLRVSAGDMVVAELVDGQRDGMVDAIAFNLGG